MSYYSHIVESMDEVFRAINDPSRRLLLDKLYERDGQTVGGLCAHLPQMTRYGVMNHLRILEEAGLLTTRRQGRSKYHYLNPVPIKLIHDRWISKYAEPRVGAIADMKARLESGDKTMEKPAHVYKRSSGRPSRKSGMPSPTRTKPRSTSMEPLSTPTGKWARR